jgi:spoIIIJ-associated protein
LDAFAIEGEVVIDEREGQLRGSVDGDHVGALVGDDGSVLAAIQHLAQRVVLRGGEGLRVLVDIGGYRAQREVELRLEADRAAARAIAEREAVELAPMSAADRRCVHEHLRERADIATYSEGDEPNRRLIVAPA